MLLPFKLPVSYDKDFAILDGNGQVLVPTILFKGDAFHYDKQRRVVHYIVELINNANSYFQTPVEEDGQTRLKYVRKDKPSLPIFAEQE